MYSVTNQSTQVEEAEHGATAAFPFFFPLPLALLGLQDCGSSPGQWVMVCTCVL